jgi:hypothetical protein
MGQHGPKAADGRRRNLEAQPGHVSLQESAKKSLTPGNAILVAGGQKGTGKTAPYPQRLPGLFAYFRQLKTR